MGSKVYVNASELLITADGGGSNGSRNRLWKASLQSFADKTGLVVDVCHLPPGTSKWNKIEHRLFSHISQTWRGQPSHQPRGHRQPHRGDHQRWRTARRGGAHRRTYEKGISISDATNEAD